MEFQKLSESEKVDRMYFDFINNLKGLLEGKQAQFCRDNEIDKHNLNKILSGKRDMSVGLFIRVMVGMGYMSKEHQESADLLRANTPLKEYLKIDFYALFKAFHFVNNT